VTTPAQRPAVDDAIDPVGPLRPRIQGVLDRFLDERRRDLARAGAELQPLVDAAADLLRGGKRLRPAFCYWGWRAAGRPDDDAVVAAAAALELFQGAALVHDDLIDDSDTRRGAASVHRRFAAVHRHAGWSGRPDNFGAAAAVLVGDLLLGWSDQLISAAGLSAAALERGRPVFDQMRTEVAGGQYLDILEQASGAARPAGQADRARRVIRFKSARYSVEHPLLLGGRLADASSDLLAAYAGYGASLGEAFQLRDDILGVFGDPDHTGKPAGDDLREGKRTVLIAYTLERADPTQAGTVSKLLGDPDLDADGVTTLREIILASGALMRVETLVSEQVEAARAALADAEVTDEGRAALTSLIDMATYRSR
jgi:geranylgeranyl diphosphate synthase type I